jgi:hypothetical protein
VQDKKTKKFFAHNTASRYVISYDPTDITTDTLPDRFNPNAYGRTGYRSLDKTKKEKYKIDITLTEYADGIYIPYGENLYFVWDNKLCFVRKNYSYRSGDTYSKPQVMTGGVTEELCLKSKASYESTVMLYSAMVDWYITYVEDNKVRIPKTFMSIDKTVSIIK